jgi:hypothetical protein
LACLATQCFSRPLVVVVDACNRMLVVVDACRSRWAVAARFRCVVVVVVDACSCLQARFKLVDACRLAACSRLVVAVVSRLTVRHRSAAADALQAARSSLAAADAFTAVVDACRAQAPRFRPALAAATDTRHTARPAAVDASQAASFRPAVVDISCPAVGDPCQSSRASRAVTADACKARRFRLVVHASETRHFRLFRLRLVVDTCNARLCQARQVNILVMVVEMARQMATARGSLKMVVARWAVQGLAGWSS